MKDKIVYFLRHGQTITNAAHIFAGHFDSPLSETGIAQAKAAKALFKHITFDKIYCSDLQRAKHTAALAIPKQTYEYTTQIREVNVGALVGKTVADCIKEYGEDFPHYRENVGYVAYGGESRKDFDARVADFMKKLENDDHAVIGVVCHGGVIRSAARYVLGSANGLAAPQNCSVCKVTYKDGKWILNKWNVTVNI